MHHPMALQNADKVIARVAEIESQRGSARAAEIIDSWREVVDALARLRAFSSGQSKALTTIIEVVTRMEKILRYDHSRLVGGTQEHWKSEIPKGKDVEFRKLVKQFLAEVRKLK